MRAGAQKGGATIGCATILLVGVVLGYLSFKIIPVYIDTMNFDEDLAREASRAGSNRWTDEKIKQDILQMANFRGFRLAETDVAIARLENPGGELRVDVQYTVPVVFPGYSYIFHFRSRAGSVVGSF